MTAPHAAQAKKSNVVPFAIAGVGLFALAAGAGLVYVATRPKVGTIEVSTNVPDVQLEVDGRTTGTGQRFTVGELDSTRPHQIVARRAGYRTRELQVQVANGEVTPVQVVLEPEAPQQVAMNLQGAPTPVQGGVIAQPVGVQPVGVQPMQPPIQQVVPQPVQQYQQPMQPVQQPMQPVQQPMQPVQQPMQPVQQPTQPVVATGPSRPVNRVRPTQPRTPPPPPVTSRITSSSTNTGGSSGGGSGFLSISTRPASRCTVAGQTFSTPRLRLALPAGTHRVQCSNPDFNVSSTFSVTIRDGQETREINHPLE